MTLKQLDTFLFIALNEGTTAQELAEQLGYDQSTASRNTDIFGSHGRGGKKGLRWTVEGSVYGDRRVKPIHLTSTGHRVAARLVTALK